MLWKWLSHVSLFQVIIQVSNGTGKSVILVKSLDSKHKLKYDNVGVWSRQDKIYQEILVWFIMSF